MTQARTNSASRTIVAYTGEGDRYAAVRRRAVDMARETGATVVFYDADAASPLASPLPTNWSAEGTDMEVPARLEPDDLDAAGRGALADEVRNARAEGVEAYGWLPSGSDARDLAVYAEEIGAERILVPADLDDPDLVDRLRGRSADEAREAARVPVEAV